MREDTILYYIYDPMCSWCWGFRPVWAQTKAALSGQIRVVYVLGGLAPETETPMPSAMQEQLQQTWRRIQTHCGVAFNFDFWTRNTPRRSTYPACKACLVAREYDRELAMYERIQHFYYLEAGNPSLYENLYTLADEVGLPGQAFRQRIQSQAIEDAFLQERMFAEQLGAEGYPSLVLARGDRQRLIAHSYTDVGENLRQIDAALNAIA